MTSYTVHIDSCGQCHNSVLHCILLEQVKSAFTPDTDLLLFSKNKNISCQHLRIVFSIREIVTQA